MTHYTMTTPRLAFGAAAGALTILTLALLVLAPAGSAFKARHETAWPAGETTATSVAAEQAVTVIEVVGEREARPLNVTDAGRGPGFGG